MKKLFISFSLTVFFLFCSFVNAADRSVVIPFKTSSMYVAGTETTSFSWPLFMPAILSGAGCSIGSFWGAYSIVCCRSSSATFSITISENTKRSFKPYCGVAATWEDWQKTSAGTKSVFWQVTSPTCSTYSGTFPWVMEKGKVYLFQLELVNGKLMIYVYSGDACSVVQNAQVAESQSLSDDTIGMETTSLKLVNKIMLDIGADAFKAN